MNNRVISILSISLIALLVAAGFCYREHAALEVSRAQLLAGELYPIAALLKENQGLIQELQSDPFVEKDSGVLESYLAKIRRDGVAKHADMKQKLDTLAENDTAIVTLIKAYAPRAKTAGFQAESDKFRNYSSAWRDRWNSVMEIFMAGGNYPTAEIQFPQGIPSAVQAEIAASR